MDNYNLQWRASVKIVALVDLILTAFHAVFFFCLSGIFGFAAYDISISNTKLPADLVDSAWLLWPFAGVTAVIAIVAVVNMWAAAKLLHATELVNTIATVHLLQSTELERAVNDSYKFCKTWLVDRIVFAVLQVLIIGYFGLVIKVLYTIIAINLLVQCLFFCTVYHFMQELKTIIAGIPQQVKQSPKV